MNLPFQSRHRLREFPGEARENRPIDGDPAPLHRGERRDHRTLQRLVNIRHALGDEARLQHAPQAQTNVRVLGGVFGRLVQRDARETDEIASRAGDRAKGDILVPEML